MSGLRCLAYKGPPDRPASPGRHDREWCGPGGVGAVIRRESAAQEQTDRPAPGSPAGAEPDPEGPTALWTRVALPQSRTNPKGRRRHTPGDAPGVSGQNQLIGDQTDFLVRADPLNAGQTPIFRIPKEIDAH
jgi:hypothetical protein